MECLKCGRETAGNEVFCSECLKDMEKHPVPANTPVVINSRTDAPRKPAQKKAQKSDVVTAQLHQEIHRLRIAVTVLALLLAVALSALCYGIWGISDEFDLGSNYSSITYPDEAELR